MKKLRNWVIGDYLAITDNVFEKAKIELTFSYSIIFTLLGLLFYGNLIANHLWYHFYIITFGIISLISIPLVLKYRQNYHLAANIYLVQQFVVSFSETIIQGAPLDVASVLFNLIVVFFSFFVYGTKKGFLISIPFTLLSLLEIANNVAGGTLVDFAFTKGQKLPDQSIFILVPLALNIFIIWRFIATRNEAEKEIQKQKLEIETRNKEVTDSITYAKRIQQAKLPKKEDIYASLSQSFVLFRPKDIVSGDFYFYQKKGGYTFIAAADCTGHGVPGAFMSLIGMEKLEDAVSQSDDISEILQLLNKGLKASLRQSGSDESTRDGMDIAICRIDADSRIVKYGGAYRPIWLIRKGKTEIEEIKATKKAIGGLTEDDQHFDSHNIKLEQGDTFYIFSDGYADTFGGANEKKLTTKKFKEVISSIQNKAMQEQEKYLDGFIEEWKGTVEQIDDILVIGVRL